MDGGEPRIRSAHRKGDGVKDVARFSSLKAALAVASFGILLASGGCTVADPTTPVSPMKESGAVGPAGGHLTLAGAELDVPPNAVGTDVTITVSNDAPKPETHLVDGLVYRFEPAGLVFSTPIKVSFPTAVPNHLVFWTRAGSTDTFEPLATSIEGSKTIAHPMHFSHGFVGGAKAKPSEKCEGARDEACGNCGTRTRTCNDGVWSDWGACVGQGACTPNATESCEGGGTRTCGSRCQWDACEPKKPCEGPASEACGNCGTRARTCGKSGNWSDWSACTGEGVCELNTTEACGAGGTRTCVAGCQWGSCTGQTCTGPSTESCGKCGTRTRSCDNGTWSSWSACTGEGTCAPSATQACGTGGTQTCNATCQWGGCTDQTCSGSSTQTCGTCGTQSRTCSNGIWSSWSTCAECSCPDPNACPARPHATATCVGTCGFTCDPGWEDLDQDASNGCEFDLSSQVTCIKKRRQTESCVGDTCTCSLKYEQTFHPALMLTFTGGENFGPLGGVSAGHPEMDAFGKWEAADASRTRYVGFNPSKSYVLRSPGGPLDQHVLDVFLDGSRAGTPPKGCEQVPFIELRCRGRQNVYSWNRCEGPTTESCGNCGTRSRTCTEGTGVWSEWSACTGQGVCSPNAAQACGTSGSQTCNASCQWDACTECVGPTTQACGSCGTQSRTCQAGGVWSSWSTCSGEGGCAPGSSRACGASGTGTQTCSASCGWDPCNDGSTLPRGRITVGPVEHACAIRVDGTLACWGKNDAGQATPPAGTFRQVTAGYRYTCGLRTDGTIACWGVNSGTNLTPPSGTFEQIDTGSGSCAIRADGTVACWGGTLTAPAGTFREVSVGAFYACGIRTNGTATCWTEAPIGTDPSGTFEHVSVGEGYACGLRASGAIDCWGSQYGSYYQQRVPSGTFRQIEAGSFTACAVRTDDTTVCWGLNPSTPPAVPFREVSMGVGYGCGIGMSGALTCWPNGLTPPSGTF